MQLLREVSRTLPVLKSTSDPAKANYISRDSSEIPASLLDRCWSRIDIRVHWPKIAATCNQPTPRVYIKLGLAAIVHREPQCVVIRFLNLFRPVSQI